VFPVGIFAVKVLETSEGLFMGKTRARWLQVVSDKIRDRGDCPRFLRLTPPTRVAIPRSFRAERRALAVCTVARLRVEPLGGASITARVHRRQSRRGRS
jgi:hypothetical protein